MSEELKECECCGRNEEERVFDLKDETQHCSTCCPVCKEHENE